MSDFFKDQLKRQQEYQNYRRYKEYIKGESPERSEREKLFEAGMAGISPAEQKHLDKMRDLERRIFGKDE